LYRQARRLVEAGDRYVEADTFLIEAMAASLVGSPSDAGRLADGVVRLGRSIGSPRIAGLGLAAGARADLRQGNPRGPAASCPRPAGRCSRADPTTRCWRSTSSTPGSTWTAAPGGGYGRPGRRGTGAGSGPGRAPADGPADGIAAQRGRGRGHPVRDRRPGRPDGGRGRGGGGRLHPRRRPLAPAGPDGLAGTSPLPPVGGGPPHGPTGPPPTASSPGPTTSSTASGPRPTPAPPCSPPSAS
jgi:hypothetical protein